MRKATIALLLVLCLLLTACSATEKASEPVVIDRDELEAFAGHFFPSEMKKHKIPGVSLVLVQDGEIVLAQGYGEANLEAGTPISPDTTVMRIGSVSKLFVATAVMQLVEAGKVDLGTDINQYLTAFQVQDGLSEPVTLAQLLTHTAGYEDPPYESYTDPAVVQPLGAYLAQSMPPRSDPPGETFRYSNHGFALAAYVVEEITGQPFDQYVLEQILQPLGMSSSGYLLGPPLPEELATGYFYENRTQVPQPMDYDSHYPGGSLFSTAKDMAKFMVAHLQGGCYGEACILQPATLAEMHRQQAQTPYEGQAVAYGFVAGQQQGQHLLGHSGAIRGFGSSLNLLPEHNLGYFFSFNEECHLTSACEIISDFREQFLKRFF